MKKLSLIPIIIFITITAAAQNVGIGTTTPKAAFHVAENKTVLFGNDTSGGGGKMMWIPSKYAFRAGVTGYAAEISPARFDSTIWNYDSIGFASVAMGFQNKAGGSASTAIGVLNEANKNYTVAIGMNNRSNYQNAVAIGVNNQSLGSASIVLGVSSVSNGALSFNAGSYNTVNGGYGIAVGSTNINDGENSVTLGNQNNSNGYGSVSIGQANSSYGQYSTAIGLGNIARSYHCFVIGNYNDSFVLSNPGEWIENDPLFIVGNGTFPSYRSNAMVILKNGRTGFNANYPEGQVHIKANTASAAPTLMLEESQDDYARINFKNTNPGYWRQEAYVNTNGSDNDLARLNFYFSRFGYIMSLRGNGNAVLTGTLYQNSDERLKKNIAPLQNALSKLSQLNAYTYQWKDTARGNEEQLGLLAQEVEKQFPQLVMTDDNGKKSVAYGNMVPVLLQAIKEQQQEINELKKLLTKK